ncbi:tellurite resistance/C4-dicarboxylate transporter family protein [Actinomadura meridiana]|uniref:Tellurite resistance/C4-dicarboxylate transporter family protein n=1 Tax=Actinomadura meridiana TaxID=559626 RepID=A0ABP8CJ69_9ACTN
MTEQAQNVPSPSLRDNGRLQAVRHLFPGYFALVMATGIVSAALLDVGRPGLSDALLAVAVVCLAVLVVLSVLRLALFPRDVGADLAAPDRTYGFFTLVAACDVVGTRFAADGRTTVTQVLFWVALPVWTVLSYGIPIRLVLGPRTRPVLAGVNGTWFIWVVGTQSLVITAATLGSAFPSGTRSAALAAVSLWSVGVVLYLIVATLVLTRLLLLEVTPDDLTPPYWVTMGATAITVLAAARILDMPGNAPAVQAAHPVIVGLAVVLWAFGTWLIPMLVAFGVWRHVLRRARLEYQPQLWSIVFPLGMYAAASMELGRAVHLPIVERIGRTWVWVAFPAWALTFAAMLGRFVLARGWQGTAGDRPSDPAST